jgi:hypothetical protein
MAQARLSNPFRPGAKTASPSSMTYWVSRIRWALCRRRHKAHYADLQIMPTRAGNVVSAAVIVAMESA